MTLPIVLFIILMVLIGITVFYINIWQGYLAFGLLFGWYLRALIVSLVNKKEERG